MSLILIIIHVIVCIALIMIVLLQTGKGADMGAAFGGGSSQTLFGSTGASTFLSKATTVAAIVFMLTSLTLAYLAGQRDTTSIMDEVKTPSSNRPRRQHHRPPRPPKTLPHRQRGKCAGCRRPRLRQPRQPRQPHPLPSHQAPAATDKQ